MARIVSDRPRSERPFTGRRRRAVVTVTQVALLFFILGSWEFIPQIGDIQKTSRFLDPFFISSPSRVANRLNDLFTGGHGSVLLWNYVRPTMSAALLGASLGMFLGAAAGLLLSNFQFLSQVLRPFVIAANATPRIALIPVIVLLVGPDFGAMIVVSVLVVFFVAFFNAYEGGTNISPDLINNAVLLGAGKWDVLRQIRLPYVLAWTMAALPLAITFGLLSVVTAEILTGFPGIGRLLMIATISSESSLTFAVVLVLAALGVTVVTGAEAVKRRILHWWGKG
jgi:NitT/TauT family transport system permease protein